MKNIAIALGSVLAAAVLVPIISLAGGSFYVDGSTGYVGVGNTTPASQLDVSGAVYSRLFAATSTSINWNQGNEQSYTLSSNSTFTFSGAQAGGKYDLILKQDTTGGRTVTWPAAVKWYDGVTPALSTIASSTTMLSFLYDGSNYLGSLTYESNPPAGIVFDAASSGNHFNTSSYTWTGPTPSGTPTLAVCGGYIATGSNHITGVTYGGTNMILGPTAAVGGSTANPTLWTAYLLNPPSGAQTVAVNLSAGSDNVYSSCVLYDGTSVSSIGNTATNAASTAASSYNTTLSVSGNKSWVVGIATGALAGVSSITGATTFSNRNSAANVGLYDTNATVSSGSNTVTDNYSSNQTGGHAAVYLEIH